MTTYEWWRVVLVVMVPALAVLGGYAYTLVVVWSLRHNIPDLHARCDGLHEECARMREQLARLEGKLSREWQIREAAPARGQFLGNGAAGGSDKA